MSVTTVRSPGTAAALAARSQVVIMADFDPECLGPDWLTGKYTNRKARLTRQLEELERGDDYA